MRRPECLRPPCPPLLPAPLAPQRKMFGAALAPAQMAGLVPAIVDVMQRYLTEWEADGKLHMFPAVGGGSWAVYCVVSGTNASRR